LNTGKERDAETGLDYFGARYFSGAQGRFTSPDAPLVDQRPEDPQSWNLYSYVRNNPLRFVDRTGRTCVTSGNVTEDNGDGKGCAAIQNQNLTVTDTQDKVWLNSDTNAVQRGDIDMSGRSDAIHDPTPGALATAAQFMYPRAATAVQCLTGNCSASNVAMAMIPGVRRVKPVNLPAWRTIAIDIEHILSGHTAGGARVSVIKSLFPASMTEGQIEAAVREAYRFGEKVATQGERVVVRGQSGGLTIEMYVNTTTRSIETAYPKF
jgi:RHS repeat-associated protein